MGQAVTAGWANKASESPRTHYGAAVQAKLSFLCH